MTEPVPRRQIRATFEADTITVYQAYSPAIGTPAVRNGRFVEPFKRTRMTWIKPSFRWMMYRCGWGDKPGQEVVLAIEVTRSGFEWALRHACLTHSGHDVHTNRDDWRNRLRASPVRVQWDPERSLHLEPLDHRSIQIGLSGTAVDRYVDEWTVSIRDVTPLAHHIHSLVRADDLSAAAAALPAEAAYPVPPDIATVIGCSSTS